MPHNTTDIKVALDPWLKKKTNRKKVPPGTNLACVYELYFGAGSLSEVVCLNRTTTHDELWIVHVLSGVRDDESFADFLFEGDHRGRVARMKKTGSMKAAALRLLELYLRPCAGYQWPVKFEREGLIGEAEYRELVQSLEAELDQNRNTAAGRTSPVIEMARELGLGPSPTGHSPVAWKATCPETKHYLFISSDSDTFGCGYCKRKGNKYALKAFVEERKQWVQNR